MHFIWLFICFTLSSVDAKPRAGDFRLDDVRLYESVPTQNDRFNSFLEARNDGPAAPAAIIDESARAPKENEIMDHINKNCTSCLRKDEAKLARKAQIRKDILEKLGFGVLPPNVSVSRDMPTFSQTPLRGILKRYGLQHDSPLPDRLNDDHDDTYAKTEKVYSFARPPPIEMDSSGDEIAYFDFASDTRRMHVREAILHVYLSQPSQSTETHAELKIEVFLRTGAGRPDKPVITKKSWLSMQEGGWIELPLKAEVAEWFRKPSHNYGIHVLCDYNGKNLASHPKTEEQEDTMYLEIETQETHKVGRERRELLKIDCIEEDKEKRCCRYPLIIDFEEFGWDWVIAPKRYEAYYCNGDCPFKHLQRYVHTHVYEQAKNKGMLPEGTAGPCCFPTQMSELMMVYMNENKEVLISKIPGMVATRCGCA